MNYIDFLFSLSTNELERLKLTVNSDFHNVDDYRNLLLEVLHDIDNILDERRK